MLPSAAETASASQRCEISELNLHGLLPCCVRFGTHQSPGEWQHSLPACSLALAGRDSHPLDFIKWFPLLHCRFLHFHAYPSATQRSLTLRPTRSPGRLRDPLHQRLQQLRCLHCCSDCYRVERTSSRAGLPRCGPPPFHGAPGNPTTQDLIRGGLTLCKKSPLPGVLPRYTFPSI